MPMISPEALFFAMETIFSLTLQKFLITIHIPSLFKDMVTPIVPSILLLRVFPFY